MTVQQCNQVQWSELWTLARIGLLAFMYIYIYILPSRWPWLLQRRMFWPRPEDCHLQQQEEESLNPLHHHKAEDINPATSPSSCPQFWLSAPSILALTLACWATLVSPVGTSSVFREEHIFCYLWAYPFLLWIHLILGLRWFSFFISTSSASVSVSKKRKHLLSYCFWLHTTTAAMVLEVTKVNSMMAN